MGNKQKGSTTALNKKKDTTELTEEEIQLLLNNTHFNRKQIEEWHTGFIVGHYFLSYMTLFLNFQNFRIKIRSSGS